jgi:hypothetical protein
MKEVKIRIEDALLDYFGYDTIENKIQDFVSKMLVKFSAMEILKDLEETDLTNDMDWQKARDLAWEQEKERYLKSLSV